MKKLVSTATALLLCGLVCTQLCFGKNTSPVSASPAPEIEVLPDSEANSLITIEEPEDLEEITGIGTSENASQIPEGEAFELSTPLVFEEDSYAFFNQYCDAISTNDYAFTLGASSTEEVPSRSAFDAWQSYETYLAGYEIYADDSHALYAVILTFKDSGSLPFPEITEDNGHPGIGRYLYVTKKDGFWYADGPLHKDLPPADWWNGTSYTWEVTDHGFSDGAGNDNNLIITQEDMNAFNAKAVAYTQNLFQCDPFATHSGSLSL